MTEPDVLLEAVLRDLGARLDVPAPPEPGELTHAVRARLTGPPRGGRAPFGGSVLLRVAAVLVAAMITLGVLVTVSPPVRAAVLHLLRFAGIEFSSESAPPPSTLPTTVTLPGERTVDLPTAQRLSRFPVSVPEALGTPEKVLLADGTPPRIVSLIYRGGTVRLDEFDGRLDQALFKKISGGDGVQWVQVGEDFGVWVDRPHEVVYVDREGKYHTESARLSAKTLIWTAGDVTLRLEGDFTLDEALAVAKSVR
ncbi:MAG TPA: hypothetical protein VGR06_25215 [Actinophytocola sp.]|jgi:hypothetical protein|uniref:hypothetical protein n=1 Tax=Actinophytocola sp. TaxID=1872138 RepID=UPI002E0A9CBA|nr:hypothetical protein [Actinophytocola sp.]